MSNVLLNLGVLLLFLICLTRGSENAATDDNNEEDIKNYDFKCDQGYLCSSWSWPDDEIDCSKKRLTCIPKWDKSIGKSIKLNSNKIHVLPDNIFRLQFNVAHDLANNVKLLDLSFNELVRIKPKAFHGLNNLENLILDYNNLKMLPTEATNYLTSLIKYSLMGNPLGNLSRNAFGGLGLIKLKELDLRFCKLESLEPNAFEMLRRLEILRLSGNKLTVIKSQTFHGLRRLQLLALNDNGIQTMEPSALEGPDNLRTLAFENNPLKMNKSCLPCMEIWNGTITLAESGANFIWNLNNSDIPIEILPKNVFRHQFSPNELCKVEQLDLASNAIIRIDLGAFSGLSGLTVLNLGNNQLRKIPIEAFVDIRQLLTLNLNENPITNLESQEFLALPNLKELDLSNCDLRKIESSAFRGLNSLEILRLDGNQLTLIVPFLFASLQNLQILKLNDNKIQMLKPDSFVGLRSIKTLELQNNPTAGFEFGSELPYAFGIKAEKSEFGLSERFDDSTAATVKIPCNCDKDNNFCVGVLKNQENILKCEVDRTLAFNLAKFVQVNVQELAISGFIMLMLGLLLVEMWSNYLAIPM